MDNEQREKIANMITDFGWLRWDHKKEEADEMYTKILDLLYELDPIYKNGKEH